MTCPWRNPAAKSRRRPGGIGNRGVSNPAGFPLANVGHVMDDHDRGMLR